MKKITVVGRGTVGVLAVAHFRRHTDWKIDWVYDPSIMPAAVGEGTNMVLPKSLYENINFDSTDMEQLSATAKFGIWKRGWGSGKEYKHTFPAGAYGIHFNATIFQEYLFNKLIQDKRITTIENNSTDYEKLDSDYVMVCTGSPVTAASKEYIKRTSIPVNSAKVFQCPWEYDKFNYSLTFAKKFGWIFGIPLKNRCAIGYLYNNSLNTEAEVTEDVQDVLSEFNLVPSVTRNLVFENYSRINNFTKRVVYNGNASFFLEPLEATSTSFADLIIRMSLDMWKGGMSVDSAQLMYDRVLDEIESMIALHYFSGSVYDTPFWKYANKLAVKQIEKEIENDGAFADILRRALNHNSYTFNPSNHVGSWPIRSFVQNIDGLDIREKLNMMLRV